MKKVAIFPGSFNSWHRGHSDVLMAAVDTFDHFIIARGINPEKGASEPFNYEDLPTNKCEVIEFSGLLSDFVKSILEDGNRYRASYCILKGLRNSLDFEYEKSQFYYNQDLGLNLPTFYVMADRNLTHISSMALRAVEKAKKK